MNDTNLVSSSAAARKLGLHESRIRALAARGRLGARKIAGRWVFDPDILDREAEGLREDGRPLNSKNAFALLFLASNENPGWIRDDVRSRLRRRLREGPLEDLFSRVGSRAVRHDFRSSDAALRKLRNDAEFIRSGISAARQYGADIAALDVLEGYYPERKLDEIVYRFALRQVPEEQANLIIHALAPDISFKGRSVMPSAVVAADLIESSDQRTRRAGHQLVRRIKPP
jgi:hypothetical protein